MKFSSTSTDLQRVLGNISGVIPVKSTLPILENYLFDLSKDKLKITATDLDISMTNTLNVKGLENGSVAVPAKKLFETVRSLPEIDIDFYADEKNNKIIMRTKNGEYKLTGETSENFPTVPQFESKQSLIVDSESLKRIISKTAFAVSTDELRLAMTGVLIQFRKSELRSVATDGHRLVRLIDSSFGDPNLERDIVIPIKALNLVLRSANDSKTTLSLNESHVMFTFGDIVLISRLIDEKYPNYESVIPADNDKNLIIDKNQFLSAIRRISLYANTISHQMRFSIKKDSVSISAEDIDMGSEARETLDCDYNSEPMEIGFNAIYIIDILSHIDADEVIFKFSTSTRASIIEPMTQRENENLLMLVMPVRLNV